MNSEYTVQQVIPFIGKPAEIWWCCPKCAVKNNSTMSTSIKRVTCRSCGVMTKLELKSN